MWYDDPVVFGVVMLLCLFGALIFKTVYDTVRK